MADGAPVVSTSQNSDFVAFLPPSHMLDYIG